MTTMSNPVPNIWHGVGQVELPALTEDMDVTIVGQHHELDGMQIDVAFKCVLQTPEQVEALLSWIGFFFTKRDN